MASPFSVAGAVLTVSSFVSVACLPADTRPEPARVSITADLPAELRTGQLSDGSLSFDTDDGWRVTLSSLFVSIGNAGLDGTSCNEYADARYRRILNLTQPGPQKVSQIWGLNDCLMSYSLGPPPTTDAVLGVGVSADERALMSSAIVPVSTPTGLSTAQGMALHIVGVASKADQRVDFDWGFATRVRYSDCKRVTNGTLEDPLPLVGGETIGVNIAIDPRELFRAHAPLQATFEETNLPPSVPLLQLMADADQVSGNANGHISFEELSMVMLPVDASLLESIPGAKLNLAEVLRLASYPAMFSYADNGRCSVEIRDSGGRGDGS